MPDYRSSEPERQEPHRAWDGPSPAELHRQLDDCKNPHRFLEIYKKLPPDDRDPLPVGARCAACNANVGRLTSMRAGSLLLVREFCEGDVSHYVSASVIRVAS
jgi:hypothetical protein